MMGAEQQGEGVTIQQLAAQPVLSIRGTVQIEQLVAVMDQRVPVLLAGLQQGGAQPAGPLFVRYHTFGETETDLETGIPVVTPVTGTTQVAAGELPGGPAVSTWHNGPHPALGDAYARLAAWLEAQGREASGPAWEVYHWMDPRQSSDSATWGDPVGWHTQLIQPIK